MRWHIHLFLVKTSLYIFFVLIFLCSFVHSDMQEIPDEITVSGKENKGQVEVALGGVLTLRLEANPGTGYSWQIVKNDDALLQPMGESIFEPIFDKKKGRVGAPAYQTFRFSAQSTGTDLIEMHYVRIWEKNIKPLKKFCITVHVRMK